MTSRLAAVLAAVFAAAMIVPPDGVVVHRHAGGDHAHIHTDLVSGAHPHEDGHHDEHGDHEHGDHDHEYGDHHEHGDHHAEAQHGDDHEQTVALSVAPHGGAAHFHTTLLFRQAVSPPPAAATPPRPLTRVALARPPVRITLARPATRSRGPPVQSL